MTSARSLPFRLLLVVLFAAGIAAALPHAPRRPAPRNDNAHPSLSSFTVPATGRRVPLSLLRAHFGSSLVDHHPTIMSSHVYTLLSGRFLVSSSPSKPDHHSTKDDHFIDLFPPSASVRTTHRRLPRPALHLVDSNHHHHLHRRRRTVARHTIVRAYTNLNHGNGHLHDAVATSVVMAREDGHQNDGDHGNGTMSIFVNGVHLVPLSMAVCPEVFVPSDVPAVLGHLGSSAGRVRKGVAGVVSTMMKNTDERNSNSDGNPSSEESKPHDDDGTLPLSSATASRQTTTATKSSSLSSARCNRVRVLRLAVAYDAALCNRFSGRASTATRYVAHVVSSLTAPAFAAFPLCVRLHVASVAAHCNASSDPFRHLPSSPNVRASDDSLLRALSRVWRPFDDDSQRTASADVALFVSGATVTAGNMSGAAFSAGACAGNRAFAWVNLAHPVAVAKQIAYALGAKGSVGGDGLDSGNVFVVTAKTKAVVVKPQRSEKQGQWQQQQQQYLHHQGVRHRLALSAETVRDIQAFIDSASSRDCLPMYDVVHTLIDAAGQGDGDRRRKRRMKLVRHSYDQVQHQEHNILEGDEEQEPEQDQDEVEDEEQKQDDDIDNGEDDDDDDDDEQESSDEPSLSSSTSSRQWKMFHFRGWRHKKEPHCTTTSVTPDGLVLGCKSHYIGRMIDLIVGRIEVVLIQRFGRFEVTFHHVRPADETSPPPPGINGTVLKPFIHAVRVYLGVYPQHIVPQASQFSSTRYRGRFFIFPFPKVPKPTPAQGASRQVVDEESESELAVGDNNEGEEDDEVREKEAGREDVEADHAEENEEMDEEEEDGGDDDIVDADGEDDHEDDHDDEGNDDDDDNEDDDDDDDDDITVTADDVDDNQPTLRSASAARASARTSSKTSNRASSSSSSSMGSRLNSVRAEEPIDGVVVRWPVSSVFRHAGVSCCDPNARLLVVAETRVCKSLAVVLKNGRTQMRTTECASGQLGLPVKIGCEPRKQCGGGTPSAPKPTPTLVPMSDSQMCPVWQCQ